VAGSISKRPDLMPLLDLLEEKGDEIFAQDDSVVFEVDINKEIVKKIFELAEKYHKKPYALVSNMSIAIERRDFLRKLDCFICNQQEAGMLFLDDYTGKTAEEMRAIIADKVVRAEIPAMVVTMGAEGAVYADHAGNSGVCPARNVQVKDTTGAGDAFCAGVVSSLTYGKTLAEAVEVGSILAASVITSSENVCPRFQPAELGLDYPG
jgi:pseudouridine kinase